MSIFDYVLGIAPALASEEAVKVVHHSVMEDLYHANVFNFLILLAILVVLIRKFNPFAAISEKQTHIANSIKTAEELKLQAEIELDGAEKKIRRLDDEVSKIITEADGVAKSLSEKLINEAHSEADNLAEKSKRSIEADKNKAFVKLSNDVSKVALTIAEEHVRKTIETDGERLHKKFVDEFIENLDNLKA
ncbi:MAG: ATP synthase F0 subunit B [bacterium]